MKLRYNKNGTFNILQLTDLHLGEYPVKDKDQKTFAGIRKVVMETTPDLLIFTGDIIYSMVDHGAPNPKEMFHYFIEEINQLNTPYAITFGNHDSEEHITRAELRQIYETYAKHQPAKEEVFIVEDRESYVLELLGSLDAELKQALFVLDSGAYSHTEASYYAWVLPEQVTWYADAAKLYNKGDQVKRHLVFQHIPVPEYWLASQNIVAGAFNEDIVMNLSWSADDIKERLLEIPFKNGVFSPEVNSGLFLRMLLNEETWGMFVGHDHDNSFDGVYKGIHLVYGQSSGYNSYGSESKGARMITLNEDQQTVETYPVFYE